jgi:hypothetical protein
VVHLVVEFSYVRKLVSAGLLELPCANAICVEVIVNIPVIDAAAVIAIVIATATINILFILYLSFATLII